jgi:hypothetical protein
MRLAKLVVVKVEGVPCSQARKNCGLAGEADGGEPVDGKSSASVRLRQIAANTSRARRSVA